MVTVYHAHGSRSLRVLWTLEEISRLTSDKGEGFEVQTSPAPGQKR